MAKAFPRKDILLSLYTTLSSISKVYTSSRPVTVPTELKNFIVVDLVGTMKDQNAYQEASLRIDLFQKEFEPELLASQIFFACLLNQLAKNLKRGSI